eukprot:6490584-Amphidinium_carterae.4
MENDLHVPPIPLHFLSCRECRRSIPASGVPPSGTESLHRSAQQYSSMQSVLHERQHSAHSCGMQLRRRIEEIARA